LVCEFPSKADLRAYHKTAARVFSTGLRFFFGRRSQFRAGTLRQKTAVKSKNLGNFHNRGPEKAREPGREWTSPGASARSRLPVIAATLTVLNSAAVEGVCLDYQHRALVAGFRTAWLGKVGPPDFNALNLIHGSYQESFSIDLIWRAMQCRIPPGRLARIKFIQPFRRAGFSKPWGGGRGFGLAEEIIGIDTAVFMPV
jgi:hypothetical protein